MKRIIVVPPEYDTIIKMDNSIIYRNKESYANEEMYIEFKGLNANQVYYCVPQTTMEELLEAYLTLSALNDYGVDNWSGHESCFAEYADGDWNSFVDDKINRALAPSYMEVQDEQ